MIDHLPVLLVVLPIVGAAVPLVASLYTDRAGWPIAVVTMLAHAALAGLLAGQVWPDNVLSYAVGGFAKALLLGRFLPDGLRDRVTTLFKKL